MTQPPEGQAGPVPPLQPLRQPGPGGPGAGQPAAGQPGYGSAGDGRPGQGYGSFQPYPGAAAGTPAPGRDPALAGWWQRLLARVIDGLVLALLISPLWFAVFLPVWHRLQTLAGQAPYLSPAARQMFSASVNQAIGSMVAASLLIAVAGAFLSFGYDWLQHGLWGQTIGKRVMGTRVVTAGSRGRISGGAACGRAAIYALIPLAPTVGLLLWVLDLLWLLWDPRRQCLHDKAARTVVVRAAAQPNSSW